MLLLTACSGEESTTTHYNLTITTEGQGSVSPSSGSYKENEALNLEPDPDSGWFFKEWQGSISGDRNPYPLVMDANYTITAVFEEIDQLSLTGEVRVSNKTAESASESITIRQTDIKFNSQPKVKSKINSIANTREQEQYKKEEIIIKYKATTSLQSIKRLEQKNNLRKISKISNESEKIIHYQLPKDLDVKKAVKKYKQLEQVEYAQPNYIYYATKIPNDEDYENYTQNSSTQLNLEAAWDQQTGDSKEITVAVVDTGIIPNHPDLQGRISSAGYDFVDGDSKPYDLSANSHGTHVAGIIGAVANNEIGVTGTNWNINIVPIRVLGTDGKGSGNIVKGIKFAAGLAVENNTGKEITIDEEVDIINLSLGGNISGSDKDKTMRDAINEATSKGILVFAASGNGVYNEDTNRYEGISDVLEPASYDSTMAVGAVNSDNSLGSYSNYGPALDLVAPGTGIYNTTGYYDSNNDSFIPIYDTMTGTSMATPYVSGVASLLLADGVSPSEVEERLKDTAVDLGEEGKDEKYGYGLVDAYGALLNRKLGPPKVFAATKSGDDLTVVSEVREFANNTTYGLDQIDADEVYIIGWRDVNNSGRVDQGDYYGQIGPITVNDYSQNNDLYLNYIGPTTRDVPITVNGLN
ncbi:S8 family serine peptidase [Halanaerobacter jeridensis]|nr:S8 family serine peptidase [Halanaerobacter jeridensis]